MFQSLEREVQRLVEFFRFLLSLKPNLNATDRFGRTPLHLAAAKGSLDWCIQLLLVSDLLFESMSQM